MNHGFSLVLKSIHGNINKFSPPLPPSLGLHEYLHGDPLQKYRIWDACVIIIKDNKFQPNANSLVFLHFKIGMIKYVFQCF